MKRRTFLKALGAGLLARLVPGWFPEPKKVITPIAPLPNLYFRHDGSSYKAYKPEPFMGTRIIAPGPVRFNSKDYGVMVVNSEPRLKCNWISMDEFKRIYPPRPGR